MQNNLILFAWAAVSHGERFGIMVFLLSLISQKITQIDNTSMTKKIIITVLAIVFLGSVFLLNKYVFQRITNAPEQIFDSSITTKEDLETAPALTTYVSGRRIIWAMDFFSDGQMIFTERGGAVSVVEPDGRVEEILSVDVHATGESGLHGIAIDPNFDENRFVYLYYTYRTDGASTLNRVSRYTFKNNRLTGERIIVDDILGASTHDGGRTLTLSRQNFFGWKNS
jgi:glucose/arabinose dehydrogenase